MNGATAGSCPLATIKLPLKKIKVECAVCHVKIENWKFRLTEDRGLDGIYTKFFCSAGHLKDYVSGIV